MDAIETYLNNVFAAFPQTEKVRLLKQEMLADMEEKYQALKQEGKSEHEAVGSVIANFGSIDEMVGELGVVPADGMQANAAPEPSIHVSRTEAEDYLVQARKSSRWTGLGVFLILLGVGLLLAMSDVAKNTQNPEALNGLGLFMLMVAIAAAVVLFIVNGVKMSKYEAYKNNRILLDQQTRAELEEKSSRNASSSAIRIAAGVAVIIISVGAFAVLSNFAPATWSSIPLALLLLLIGLSVFLIITTGTTKAAYDTLLGKADFASKKQNKKSDKVIGAVASGFFPLLFAAYLFWSFIGDAWDIAWILFPIGGVLFGAFAGIISVLLRSEKD
jgi:MFS family permease